MTHPVDNMFRSQRNIERGVQAGQELCKDKECTSVAATALIGAGIGAAIPPNGAFVIPGFCIGAIVALVAKCICKEIENRTK